MEEESIRIPFIYFAVIVFFILAFLYYLFDYLNSTFLKGYIGRYLFLRNIDKVYLPYLRDNFPFYNALNDRDKIRFERRVQKFINMKHFVPRGGISEITHEMKALIAGSAVLLTFGYPSIYFRHFWKILIYPDNYYSTITRKFHKGEVNPWGIIVLSWEDLKEGFRCHADGYHLGLHEMAHALRLINIIDNDEYDFYDRSIMKDFDKEAYQEISKINLHPHEKSIFREYAATNKEEFFAVAVELFFEQSNELKRYNSRLFDLLTKILKIDPSAVFVSSGIQNLAS
jgi:MtfA peptidase